MSVRFLFETYSDIDQNSSESSFEHVEQHENRTSGRAPGVGSEQQLGRGGEQPEDFVQRAEQLFEAVNVDREQNLNLLQSVTEEALAQTEVIEAEGPDETVAVEPTTRTPNSREPTKKSVTFHKRPMKRQQAQRPTSPAPKKVMTSKGSELELTKEQSIQLYERKENTFFANKMLLWTTGETLRLLPELLRLAAKEAIARRGLVGKKQIMLWMETLNVALNRLGNNSLSCSFADFKIVLYGLALYTTFLALQMSSELYESLLSIYQKISEEPSSPSPLIPITSTARTTVHNVDVPSTKDSNSSSDDEDLGKDLFTKQCVSCAICRQGQGRYVSYKLGDNSAHDRVVKLEIYPYRSCADQPKTNWWKSATDWSLMSFSSNQKAKSKSQSISTGKLLLSAASPDVPDTGDLVRWRLAGPI